MNVKVNVTTVGLLGILFVAALVTPALAATQTPAKMTCNDFVMLDDTVKPKVVYWAEGFNKKGKPVDAVVDVDETDKLVPTLVADCKSTPKAPILQKMKAQAAAKKTHSNGSLAGASTPTKMTCADFVALDDVVKPKVVYWSEGFSKNGKPADADIDVDETDKLVPVLISECTATPKMSFWQKVKSHV